MMVCKYTKDTKKQGHDQSQNSNKNAKTNKIYILYKVYKGL